MMKVDVYGDVYDDGTPDDADFFNKWLYEEEIKRKEETFIAGTASDGFFKDMANVPYFKWENNVLMFDIGDIKKCLM